VIAWLLVAGCPSSGPPAEVAVFAASSLTDAFEELARDFEQEHPGVDVRLTFAGSQVLRVQIEQGAAADVFAAADERHLAALVDAGDVRAPRVFADNALTVITPEGSPVSTFADLPRASRVVVGTEHGPIGTYTRELWRRSREVMGGDFADAVQSSVVSQETNVRLVRAKVELGEADAAVVYRTDVSDRVREVPVPEALAVRARYPIGLVDRPGASPHAAAFVEYVLGPGGQATLARHRFSPHGRR